ncbi:MAG TPA: hypothetical protein VGS79_11505 [Puia sp.]|nr:hypothetical protein [Puia sp.]
MKKLLFAALALVPFLGWAQDAARWAKARDYLSCHLALEAIRSKVGGDTAIRGLFARVEPVLAGASIEAPPSATSLDATLKDFARVRQLVVEPVSRIDVRRFAALPDGARRLVDTACMIVERGYAIPMAMKVAMGSAVVNYLAAAPQAPDTISKVPARKPVIALGGQPDGQAAAAASASRGRFDLWVLLPLLLLGVLCLVLWRKYQEIKEELRARKVEMRSFNDNYFKKGGGSGSGPDRKAIERAIADSNVIAELNQAIGRLQLRIAQLEGKPVAAAVSAGAGSAGAPKNKLKVAEPVKAVDGADVFYMSGPVNNYFPNSAKSFTKDNTVYRFKVSPNRQDAEFELHTSGAPINEIVQLAESYIKSACDEENLPSYPVKNIITKKAGQAILEGDKWIIKSKALIRYE